MNLSQASWTSGVKSAGKRAAIVTSRQWDRSCGGKGISVLSAAETPPAFLLVSFSVDLSLPSHKPTLKLTGSTRRM